MISRSVDEPHRVSSQLELLFDLTFVVAVASITAQLAHALAGGHALAGVVPFLQVFFAIWWAWMNFTWFASSYDTDDVPYRLMTLVQMAGVLVLAAGVPSAVEHLDFRAVTLGYFIMRLGLVAQWLRAAREDPECRSTALRYAVGISAVQAGWIARLALAESGVVSTTGLLAIFAGLVVLELTVPVWAEHNQHTSWHPHHIAERYTLFTIILLGESVLAASTGVAEALDTGLSGPLVATAAAGLVLLFTLWWLYSLEPSGEGLASRRRLSYLWGYAHYGIFASLAALGAGLEVAVQQAEHHTASSPISTGYGVAVPVGVFLVLLWLVHAPIVASPTVPPAALAGAAVACLLLPLLAGAVGLASVLLAIAAVCALVIVVTAVSVRRRAPAGPAAPDGAEPSA
jgi:low temperature requirement protein LtrA